MSVYRVRPQDAVDEECHSSDMASDEELIVDKEGLKEALETRIGGKHREDDVDNPLGTGKNDEDVSHHDNSRAGMDCAQHIWSLRPTNTEWKHDAILFREINLEYHSLFIGLNITVQHEGCIYVV